MRVTLRPAVPEDAGAILALRWAVADDLTARHGRGPWTTRGTEKGVLFDIRRGGLYAAQHQGKIIASLMLVTKKPWAIDPRYFTPSQRPLHLISMAVHPSRQGQGIGRECLAEAVRLTKEFPPDAIRLDAFDAPAGAGEFYRKCGFEERGRVKYRGTPLIYFEKTIS